MLWECRQAQLNMRMNILVLKVQREELSLDQYTAMIKERIERDRLLARFLTKEGRKAEAVRSPMPSYPIACKELGHPPVFARDVGVPCCMALTGHLALSMVVWQVRVLKRTKIMEQVSECDCLSGLPGPPVALLTPSIANAFCVGRS